MGTHPKTRCEYDGKCYRENKFHWEDFRHDLQDGPVPQPKVSDWLKKKNGTSTSSAPTDDASASCASTQGDTAAAGAAATSSRAPVVLVPETPDPSPAKTDATIPMSSSVPAKRPAEDDSPVIGADDSDEEEVVMVAKRSLKRSRAAVLEDSDDDEGVPKPSPKMKNSTRLLEDDEEVKEESDTDRWETAGRGAKKLVVDLTDDVSDMRSYKPKKRRIKEDESDVSSSEEEEEEASDDEDAQKAAEDVLSECELISQTLASALASMEEDANGDLLGQPKCLGEASGFRLKHYQLVGMNWLRVLHSSDVNGILADEMGLGKTVQSISFLAHLLEREGHRGPHLVVCPASVVANWEREFTNWLPSVKVVVYHGSQAERTTLRDDLRRGREWDVMLTTYTYFERESCKPDRNFLKKQDFTCVILDEAHSIKNANSSRYKRLLTINCQRRFLLTGTPINNSLPELLVLLQFLMPQLFDLEDEALQDYFCAKKSDSADEASRVERVKMLMAPFVLRRRKKDVLTELVDKVEKHVRLELDGSQLQVYTGIISRWKLERERSAGEDRAKTINNIFCELRKAANHPLLVRSEYNEGTVETIATHLHGSGFFGMECSKDQVLSEISGYSDFQLHNICRDERRLNRYALSKEQVGASAKLQHLAELLPRLKAEGHRVLLFSQWTTMLDVIQEFVEDMGVSYLRLDGSTGVQERQVLIDKYNEDTSILCFLLSTRAGGMGINLTAADTVILHDVDFNPQIDRQAEDRCHRIGQTRPVTVYRLMAAGTVDEEINKMAEKKGKMANQMLDGEGGEEEDDLLLLEEEGAGGGKAKGGTKSKAAAAAKGQSMQEVIEQMLAKVLAEAEKGGGSGEKGGGGKKKMVLVEEEDEEEEEEEGGAASAGKRLKRSVAVA